jgi:hypothetical protein
MPSKTERMHSSCRTRKAPARRRIRANCKKTPVGALGRREANKPPAQPDLGHVCFGFWKAAADYQTLSFSVSFYKIRWSKNHPKST